MRVLGRSGSMKIEVVADATGLTSRAGTVLLAGFCQRIGLSDLLSAARQHVSARRCMRRAGCWPGWR
jgi:hypothetical protein